MPFFLGFKVFFFLHAFVLHVSISCLGMCATVNETSIKFFNAIFKRVSCSIRKVVAKVSIASSYYCVKIDANITHYNF